MSSGINAMPSGDRGGRAIKLGRRRAFLAAAASVVAASVVLVLLLSAGGRSASNSTFGQLPAWLPKVTTPSTPQYEQATSTHPILSEEQGYTVHAALPTGSADITVVGPGFPGYVASYAARGLWPANRQVPSTFYVTIAEVKGTIPLSAGAFSVENQAYQRVAATLSLKDGGQAPASVHAGQNVTLAVHTKTLQGQGAIAWSPLGSKALIAWIYQVELD